MSGLCEDVEHRQLQSRVLALKEGDEAEGWDGFKRRHQKGEVARRVGHAPPKMGGRW